MSNELTISKSSRLDDSLFSKEQAPHYMQLAGKLSSSELVPKAFRSKPQDLFLCWAIGYSIGMSPEQSMQCIAIINGKPCMWGDEMLALCMAHKEFDDIIEEPMLKDDSVIGYRCTVKRKGKSDKVNIFTLDMAKKAGLLAKGGVWNQYPERMLKLRARGFSLRDAFPDALKGIKSREEVEDYIDGEVVPTQTEKLKQQIIERKHNENNHEDENSKNSQASVEDEGFIDLVEAGEQATRLTSLDKLKILLEERDFPVERINKALAYYGVENIDSLTDEMADNFIVKILKD